MSRFVFSFRFKTIIIGVIIVVAAAAATAESPELDRL